MTTKEKVAKAKELRSQGLSYAAIGKIIGVVKSTVRYYLLENRQEKLNKRFKKPNKPCETCDKEADIYFKRRPRCYDCLCAPLPKQTAEDFASQSSCALANNKDAFGGKTFGRKSELARALNRAIKKHKIPAITPHEWAAGIEHY